MHQTPPQPSPNSRSGSLIFLASPRSRGGTEGGEFLTFARGLICRLNALRIDVQFAQFCCQTFGPLSFLFGSLSFLFGSLSFLFGSLSFLFGSLSFLFGPLRFLFGPLSFLFGTLAV